MVAQLLRLRAQSAVNTLRLDGRARVVAVLGLLAALAAVVAIASSWVSLRTDSVDVAGAAIIVTGAVALLALFVVPLFRRNQDPLDPRRLSLAGVNPIGVPVAVAAIASIPGLLVAILAAGQLVVWADDPDAVFFSVLAVPVIVVTAVLLLRVALSVAEIVRGSHRAQLAMRVVVGAAVVVLLASFDGIDRWDDPAGIAADAAGVLAWTPFGAAWAAPSSAAGGEAGTAVAQLVLAVVYVAALAAAWWVLVPRVLGAREPSSVPRTAGLGWFRVVPATATGVIAGRTTHYWIRDARYTVSLIVVPTVPLLLVVPLAIAGVPTDILALVPVPVAALFLGWLLHNDTAHDNNAIWLHVVSHTSGIADRLGRAIPILIAGIPLLVIGSLVSTDVFGESWLLPTMLGASFCIFLCGVGVASVISVLFPYAVVRPGENPFTSPQSADGGSSRAQTLSFVLTLLLSAPTLYVAWRTVFQDDSLASMTLFLGFGSGLFVLLAGLAIGAAIFARRRTALLAFSMRN